MMETYKRAVDHLEFTDDLYRRVLSRKKPAHRIPVLRIGAAATLAVLLITSSAIAATPPVAERTMKMCNLGTSDKLFKDALTGAFTHSKETAGVSTHYLELRNYSAVHGMLYSSKDGFARITEEYEIEKVPSKTAELRFEKDGRVYTMEFHYIDTENGVVSPHKTLYQRNSNGEILLNLTSENSFQWPVYFDPETGQIRDALPSFSLDDFEGREVYAWKLQNGILMTTIVGEESGSNGRNQLHFIPDGKDTAMKIELPVEAVTWEADNGSLYAQDSRGRLYRLNESNEFIRLTDYATSDDLTKGLLTVRTGTGKLGIYDAYAAQTYVIPEISVKESELHETRGYNATRYCENGPIVLVHTTLDRESLTVRIDRIGIVDTATGTLRYLDIKNEYDGYYNYWLDESRFAVRYRSGNTQYLCVYEFE